MFVPLLSPAPDRPVEADALGRAPLRLAILERHLSQQDYLLDRHSVADASLATVLNWAPHAKVELDRLPALQVYRQRITGRPAVARALREEFALWKAEQKPAGQKQAA